MRVSHTCRQPLNSLPGGPRSCPLQGCYAQRPVNSLWPVASCLCWALRIEVEQEGHPDRAAGKQLQRKGLEWQLRKERKETKLHQRRMTSSHSLYQAAQKWGSQLGSNTVPDAPVPGPDNLRVCSCVIIEHLGASAPLRSHGNFCKPQDATSAQQHL